MSDLLNDSSTAVKVRDKILAELGPDEQVFYAAEGQVTEPTGSGPGDFNLYVGAIIVTNERLLVAEAKMMGRAAFWSLPWADVDEIGRYPDGTLGYKKKLKQGVRWPLWKAQIWEGKSYKTPLDAKALDILAISSQEAFDAVSQAALATRVEDASSAYEELKRRRAQQ
jgi:hypothetical protein